MAGNLRLFGFLSMVGLAITLSKEALIGVALAAQLTLCCSFLETPTLHAQTALNLHDLGQLWAYCKLCDPAEAFLLSSVGLGSLDKILRNLGREDMLDYGDGREIKKMRVAKWDISRSSIDNLSIIPKM